MPRQTFKAVLSQPRFAIAAAVLAVLAVLGVLYGKYGACVHAVACVPEALAPLKPLETPKPAPDVAFADASGELHMLDLPFMVVATENPIEYEGTYPLPEAQLDRFMFKVLVPYAPPQVEMEVLRRYHQGFDAHNLASAGIRTVLSAADVLAVRTLVQQVTVEDGILQYVTSLNAASRRSADLVLGASARAATHVLLASKTFAALQGRDYVTPDDIKFIVPPVFRHRVLLKPEAEIEGLDADVVIQRLLAQVEVPR